SALRGRRRRRRGRRGRDLRGAGRRPADRGSRGEARAGRLPRAAGPGAQRQPREPGGEGDPVPRGRVMEVLLIHLVNALLYASVLFLIAGGLSLIYGVMRIVNLAHGNLYAFGAYVTAWAIGGVAAGAPSSLLLVLLAAVFLWAFIYKTRFGVVLRATSQNMRMASALGVNVNRVYVQAFTLGCFMAGLGGAIVVPGQSAVLGMGVDALVLAFIVVVIGGLGSLEGALVGALIVGVVREAGIAWFPEIELAVLYLAAAIVLLVRPAGLFGRP